MFRDLEKFPWGDFSFLSKLFVSPVSGADLFLTPTKALSRRMDIWAIPLLT
jgi:hypothetical protein